MCSFITNFQSPVELDDLVDRYKRNRVTNLEMVINHEKYAPIEWTVDKDAAIGDTVYFMCAKTSIDHIGHLCALLRRTEETDKGLIVFAEALREKYKRAAGHIIAVGRVADQPFRTEITGWENPYWRSPWYARIENIHVLDVPVGIAEFRDCIKVSRTVAITKLTQGQEELLQNLIAAKDYIIAI